MNRTLLLLSAASLAVPATAQRTQPVRGVASPAPLEAIAADVSERALRDYVARLVGLNLLRGRASGHHVELVSGGACTTAADCCSGVSRVGSTEKETSMAAPPETATFFCRLKNQLDADAGFRRPRPA